MKNRPGSLFALAAAFALTLAGASPAWADGDRHYYKRYDHGYSHDRHYKGRHYDRYYGKQRYHKHRKHKNNKNRDDDELLIGLVVGGLLGYAISQSQAGDSYDSNRYPPASAPPPRGDYAPTRYETGYRDHTCLQEREYQTRVLIGGKEVDAYGTACLQPDGSWRRGPAQLVSY